MNLAIPWKEFLSQPKNNDHIVQMYENDRFLVKAVDKSVYNDGSLQSICESHSHVIPAEDYSRFEGAMSQAFTELVAVPENETLRTLFDTHQRRRVNMPEAQSTIIWINEHLPLLADQIIDRANQYYASFAAPV